MKVQNDSLKSHRIASNTIVLFIRIFILTIINLYMVRLILQGLGEVDYGLYNTIAGVVTATSVLSGVMALSIQRYYSYAMGQKDPKQLQEIFSTSICLLSALSIIILIALETFGLWFVNTQLVIPADRLHATLWIYQFSIFILVCSIIQIPYTAAIFSHEDMGIYALISTIECLLKLFAAYCIVLTTSDKLIFYVAGLFVIAIIIMIMYAMIGSIRYKECHFSRPNNRKLLKELLSFSGWTLFGSLASTAMLQGNTILLNVFYGPIIVAAFGIALQINNAFNALCSSMVLAFRPPMIKSFAKGDHEYLNQLFSACNKFIFYILIAIAIPIIANMDVILEIWLDKATPNMVLFSRLIIVYILILAMHSPITIIMQASGHIKEYHLPVESVTLLCLPLTWILFRFQLPAYSVFISMISVCLVAHVIRLVCLRHFYMFFSIKEYTLSFAFPAISILALSSLALYQISHHIDNSLSLFSVSFLGIPAIVFSLAYLLGINTKERYIIKDMLQPILSKLTCQK